MTQNRIEHEINQYILETVEKSIFEYQDESTVDSIKKCIIGRNFTYNQQKDNLKHYRQCLVRIKKDHGIKDFDNDPDNKDGKFVNRYIGIKNGARKFMAVFFKPLKNQRLEIYNLTLKNYRISIAKSISIDRENHAGYN
jgi:hypothetical protein